jgi:hypothetical protein
MGQPAPPPPWRSLRWASAHEAAGQITFGADLPRARRVRFPTASTSTVGFGADEQDVAYSELAGWDQASLGTSGPPAAYSARCLGIGRWG